MRNSAPQLPLPSRRRHLSDRALYERALYDKALHDRALFDWAGDTLSILLVVLVATLGLSWGVALQAQEVEETESARSASFDRDWPGFRGPAGDGAADPGEADWPDAARLEALWERPLGPSYSSIAVVDGRGYVAYGEGENDWLLAFETATGVEAWRVSLGSLYAGHDGSHDGPITSPLAHGGRVFAAGGHGRFVAVDAASGEELWVRDLAELGELPFYGFSSSPLAVDGKILVGVSTEEGPSLLALDPATGETLWAAGDDQVSYQSPVAVEIDGATQVVFSGNQRLFGLDPASGEELWRYDLADEVRAQGQASSTPLPLGDDRLLVKRDAYSHTAIRLVPAAEEEGAAYTVEELWSNDDLARSYVPPVSYDGAIFGYKGGFLVAVGAADGETLWRSRPPGDGFLTRVGDDLVVITKKGELFLAEASAEGWKPKADTRLFDSAVWSPVTVADGTIYARSMESLAAVAVEPREDDAESAAEWPGSELPESEFGRFLVGLETAEDRSGEVDSFFAGLDSLPLIEGEWVHFIYRGDAESVGLTGDMLGDRVQGEMTRVPGTDLFYSSHRLPEDAWISYQFIPGLDADPIADPHNPLQAAGESEDDAPASVLAMPGLEPPSYLVDPSPARGRIVRHEIPISGAEESEEETDEAEEAEAAETPQGPPPATHRLVDVYVPAGEAETLPVVYVFLGDLSRRLMSMDNILDHLIGDELPAAHVVFIHRQVSRGYFDVFPGYDAQKEVFFGDVVPFLEERYAFADRRSYVGAGFGAFLAGRMALEEPSAAERVALVQPFWLDRSRALVMEKAKALAEMLEESGGDLPSFYLERSHFDLRAEHEGWNAFEQTGIAAQTLAQMGFPVQQTETNMGFDWGAWKWRMGHALAFALTGDPLAAQPGEADAPSDPPSDPSSEDMSSEGSEEGPTP